MNVETGSAREFCSIRTRQRQRSGEHHYLADEVSSGVAHKLLALVSGACQVKRLLYTPEPHLDVEACLAYGTHENFAGSASVLLRIVMLELDAVQVGKRAQTIPCLGYSWPSPPSHPGCVEPPARQGFMTMFFAAC